MSDFKMWYIKDYKKINSMPASEESQSNIWFETSSCLTLEPSKWNILPVSYFNVDLNNLDKFKLREEGYKLIEVELYDLSMQFVSSALVFVACEKSLEEINNKGQKSSFHKHVELLRTPTLVEDYRWFSLVKRENILCN